MKYFYKIGKNEIWGQFGPSEYNILGACENSLPPNWVLLVLRAYKVINSWKEIGKTNEPVIKWCVGNIRTDGRAGATLANMVLDSFFFYFLALSKQAFLVLPRSNVGTKSYSLKN